MRRLNRGRHVRSLSARDAGDLVAPLSAIWVDRGRGYEGRVAGWTAHVLLRALEARRAGRAKESPHAAQATGTYAVGSAAPRERLVVEMLAGALDEDAST